MIPGPLPQPPQRKERGVRGGGSPPAMRIAKAVGMIVVTIIGMVIEIVMAIVMVIVIVIIIPSQACTPPLPPRPRFL